MMGNNLRDNEFMRPACQKTKEELEAELLELRQKYNDLVIQAEVDRKLIYRQEAYLWLLQGKETTT